jgi:hypothetical protein
MCAYLSGNDKNFHLDYTHDLKKQVKDLLSKLITFAEAKHQFEKNKY